LLLSDLLLAAERMAPVSLLWEPARFLHACCSSRREPRACPSGKPAEAGWAVGGELMQEMAGSRLRDGGRFVAGGRLMAAGAFFFECLFLARKRPVACLLAACSSTCSLACSRGGSWHRIPGVDAG
jgi:hypothetical protein